MTAPMVALQLGFVLQMGLEEFQHENLVRVRTMPRHSGDHNDRDSQGSVSGRIANMSARPSLMLGLQCYAKIKVKYAVVVMMVT